MYVAQKPSGATGHIFAALKDASRRGLRIRFLIDDRGEKAYAFAAALAAEGMDARIIEGAGAIHDKVILIDGGRMIVGSHNWTNAALEKNREASLLLIGPEAAFSGWKKDYDDRWDAAVPVGTLSAGGPVEVPADGVAPANISFHDVRGRLLNGSEYLYGVSDLMRKSDRRLVGAVYFISPQSVSKGGEFHKIVNELFR